VAAEPSISAVVPVRNGERFLARALESIARQHPAPSEILVVDGHSTDATESIARPFPGVSFLVQAGQGIADAYNHGIANARGDVVAFLSCDDEWTPDKLSTQAGYLRANPAVMAVRAHARYVLEPGFAIPPGFQRKLLEGAHPGAMETLVARRETFRTVGWFDSRFTTGEDLDWVARARDLGVSMSTLPDVLLIKHIHDANISLQSPANDRFLLTLLRESIARKQGRPL